MADKSLDQIIKERKTVGSGRGRGRGRGAFHGGSQRNVGQQGGGGRGGVQKRGGGNSKVQMPNRSQVIQSLTRQKTFRPNQAIAVTVPDARNKLISKARLTDAREKLNKKAQLVDVRMKLNAKRQRDPGQQGQQGQQGQGDMPQVQGPETGAQLRNQGNKLPKQFTVNNPSAQKQPRQMTGPTQFTISNTQAMTQGGRPNAKKPTVSLGAQGLQVTTINKSAKKRQARQQMQFQRTIPTEDTFEDELLFQPVSAKFKRITTQAVPAAPQANIKTTIQNVQPMSALQRVATQQPPSVNPVSSAQGTRLIVSHLHSSVSEADIKELYGDVGPLKRARLVRSGLAEVVYVKREHALEAIARYHNRELDGLPMQCKLDTSTVPEATGLYVPVTGKRMSMSDRFKVIGGGSTGTTDYSSTVGMRSDAMAPSSEPLDTSTVQKALFKTGVSAAVGNRPVVFTVKI
ncbi:polymerase delta-interacting protein 3-like isoform X2 [Asterias rubens]|uniref:polymerase delta-interacting protein 3-like isoform X2 n=1 Tax=Asterias rubens TaxID=7604 RepID=UPI001454F801|nr:polymerase delta-interacting protein 3-like isoform X2 [Asterias rubens]